MDLHDLFVKSRSIRKFEQKEVGRDLLEEILEDVRLSPCGSNKQLLRFAVVTDRKICDKIADNIVFAALLPRGIADQKANERATAYIIILEPQNAGRVQDMDIGIAAEVIMESACDKGLGTCMMLNFKADEIEKILEVPGDMKAAMVIPVGYPMHESIAEDMPADGDTAYYVDEKGNYHVPKRSVKDIVSRYY